MEHFGRWLAASAEKRLGTKRQLLGVFGGGFFPLLAGPILAVLAAQNHSLAAGCALLGVGGIAFGSWIPYARFRRENRDRSRFRKDFDRLFGFQFAGKLAEELGGNAAPLEEAAKNWETLSLLAERRPLSEGLSEEIRREADTRMDRVFDLTLTPPAYYGLSREAAAAQVAADQDWLAHASRAMEDATLTGEALAQLEEDPLLRLRSLAAERETALSELRA